MGYSTEHIGFEPITLRLSAHGGERERQDGELAEELKGRLWRAMAPILGDPRYREILLFEPEYYLGPEPK